MDKVLTISTSVVYKEEDIKTHRFLDDNISHSPISYTNGQAHIKGGTKNHELLTNVNVFILCCNSPFSLRLGDTTSQELTNIKRFIYDGDTTTVFVSNMGVDPLDIKVISAKL